MPGQTYSHRSMRSIVAYETVRIKERRDDAPANDSHVGSAVCIDRTQGQQACGPIKDLQLLAAMIIVKTFCQRLLCRRHPRQSDSPVACNKGCAATRGLLCCPATGFQKIVHSQPPVPAAPKGCEATWATRSGLTGALCLVPKLQGLLI